MADRAFAPVGVTVFGVSTPLTYRGFGLTCAVVEAIAGKTLHLHISGLEQLREGFARRDGGSVVVTSDFPDVELMNFVCESSLPLIVVADDAETLLDWTIGSRGMSPMDAARFCSRMYSSLAHTVDAPHKLIVASDSRTSPQQAVREIVEYLWPGQGDDLAIATHAHLADTGRLAPPPQISDAQGETSAELKAARAAVAGYAAILMGQWPEEIVWPLNLFTRPDERPWGDPIDLTGPARGVLYGPYMHLPVGDWKARVEFEVDGALSGVEAVTDVRVNELVSEKAFMMPAKGMFSYELGFRVEDPHHAVEIRLFIKKSAIEGVFLPRSVRVTPQRREAG